MESQPQPSATPRFAPTTTPPKIYPHTRPSPFPRRPEQAQNTQELSFLSSATQAPSSKRRLYPTLSQSL
ncbi:hypothetical protein Hypma_000131 [Hypsizygus marmoreus]|uniref:Uncharacterized protein n=1 Tax=Hypsizygus marmoreus TaxID=39966 RepID=A0A369K8M4_HYPMA|nr:hypothetical protein Hypma_000131 [Hypsizygus marmoreus]